MIKVRFFFVPTFCAGKVRYSINPSLADIALDNTTNTYYIYSAEGLLAFSYLVNNTENSSGATLWGDSSNYNFDSADNKDADVVLMADIDLSVLGATTNWTPIGNNSNNYAGTFDGGGFTIKNLYYSSDNSLGGLFGYTKGATLKNINVADASIQAGSTSGILVARAIDSNIINCNTSGSMKALSGDCEVLGGLVGISTVSEGSTATIANCYNSASLDANTYAKSIGGLIGDGTANGCIYVTNCYTYATDYTAAVSLIGSLLTNNNSDNATLTNCYYLGDDGDTLIGAGDDSYTEISCTYMSSTDMQNETFVSTLNNGAYTYNQGVADGGVLACAWEAVESGTPDLDPTAVPTLSVDIAYIDDLYHINSAKGLLAFSYLVSNTSDTSGATTLGDASAFDFSSVDNIAIKGKLTQDIDLSEVCNATDSKNWSPIGRKEEQLDKPFSGTFDGGGYTITGLYINDSSSGGHQALFGYTTNATLQNITLEDVNVSAEDYVGGLVGELKDSSISNCHVVGGTVSATSVYAFVGGVVGYTLNATTTCTIINSSNSANVSGVEGNESNSIGGILGNNGAENATITNCYNNGNISNKGDGRIGGIVGYNNKKLTINTCYSSGDISGGATGYVAGIVGYSSNTLTLNYCFFDYNGDDLVGSASSATCIADVYSGTVSADVMTNGTLLTWLNNGASTYNYGNPEIEAYEWTGDSDEYPKLDPSETPKFDADEDIVYDADSNTYEITTPKGLLAFSDLVNGAGNLQEIFTVPEHAQQFDFSGTTDNTGIDAKLVDDIDFLNLDGYTWTPIGDDSHTFEGTFDGDGYTISNLKSQNSTATYQGLFGSINSATLKNISLENVTVEGFSSVGGLVGFSEMDVEIINCYVTGSVAGTADGACVGGIVGCIGNQGANITNCYNKSSVTGSDAYSQYQVSVGGIVVLDNTSHNSTAITNCYNVGMISGGKDGCMGGIVGSVSSSEEKTTLTYCYADTALQGTDSNGIVDGTCSVMETADMQDDSFVTTLNNGAYLYNYGTPAIKAYGWKSVTNSSPTIDPSLTPSFTADDDIVYDADSKTYEITTAKGLLAFSDLVNGVGNTTGVVVAPDNFDFSQTNQSINGKLTQAIDLSEVCGESIQTNWSPIGTNSYEYNGIFDGGSYTIKNLYINDTDEVTGYYQGLFGYAEDATLQNISLEGVNVTGYYYVGGLAGEIYQTTINNSSVDGNVIGNDWVGGLVGNSNQQAEITNCYVAGSVEGTASGAYVGGVVGYIRETGTNITNCYNKSSVTTCSNASANGAVGGIVGYDTTIQNQASAITNCYNVGKLSGGADSTTGGISGYASSYTTLTYCFANTALVGSGSPTVNSTCKVMDDYDMQDAGFVTTLNNGAYTYNSGKVATKDDAYGWKEITGDYPALDSTIVPTFTQE